MSDIRPERPLEELLPNIAKNPAMLRMLMDCDKTLAIKGKDYTQGNEDRLRNFDQASIYLNQTPFQTLGTYLYKHMAAVMTFCGHGNVESEPIESRVMDCINYLLLLATMIRRTRVVNDLKKEYENDLKRDAEQPLPTTGLQFAPGGASFFISTDTDGKPIPFK